MTHEEKIKWCIERHTSTNHYYDKYLPYEFHLRMVVQAFNDWKYLLERNLFTFPRPFDESIHADATFDVIELACWGHDLMEDARVSYNDCIKNLYVSYKCLNEEIAEIIRAVTNYGRGRNRQERMPDFVYEDIRNTPGAIFVKLCDRIANVQYSKMTKSSMYDKYKKENPDFLIKVGADKYPEMRDYLLKLFE